MFQLGAQVTLADIGNVVGLDYNDDYDLLRVITSATKSDFRGLVRVSSQTSSVNFSKSESKSGVSLIAKSGNVDVEIPRLELRTKLNQRKFVSNKDSLTLDFDSTTGQTEFVLPVGYTATSVSVAGARKIEGSTKDWTRLFDGFRETVKFAVSPGNAAWVRIVVKSCA